MAGDGLGALPDRLRPFDPAAIERKLQRGLNEQPCGTADSRGIEPGICTSRAASPASVGIAPINPLA